MSVDAQVFVSVLAGLILAAVLFRRAVWQGVRLLLRTAVGGAALWVLSQIGLFGLGANLVNAAVLGVLGVPGFGLLLALRWLTGSPQV